MTDRVPVADRAQLVEPGAAPGTLDGAGPGSPPRLSRRGVLLAVAAAVVLLLVGATAGIALSGREAADDAATPTSDSVDAGFARDMIVHHAQGVTMARAAELHTDDDEIRLLGYDMGYTQTAQIGQMQGWLALWSLPQVTRAPAMAWMSPGGDAGHGAGHESGHPGGQGSSPPPGQASTAADTAAADAVPMPGMASDAELARLEGLRGNESDVFFLQLMVRHHLGGAAMMEDAAARATSPVVRNFAEKMFDAQSAEAAVMTQMLEQRGAAPLTIQNPVAPAG